MAPVSASIQIVQAIWNYIYRDSALRTFRLTLEATSGGRDFDISLSNESFPLGNDLPGIDESPAILVFPNDPLEIEGRTHKLYNESARFVVRIWIHPSTPDQAFRFHELVKYALLRGHEQRFVDATSPGLVAPIIDLVEMDPPGAMKRVTDEDDRAWFTADFGFNITRRFNLDSVS